MWWLAWFSEFFLVFDVLIFVVLTISLARIFSKLFCLITNVSLPSGIITKIDIPKSVYFKSLKHWWILKFFVLQILTFCTAQSHWKLHFAKERIPKPKLFTIDLKWVTFCEKVTANPDNWFKMSYFLWESYYCKSRPQISEEISFSILLPWRLQNFCRQKVNVYFYLLLFLFDVLNLDFKLRRINA